jgi:hypothetical protein
MIIYERPQGTDGTVGMSSKCISSWLTACFALRTWATGGRRCPGLRQQGGAQQLRRHGELRFAGNRPIHALMKSRRCPSQRQAFPMNGDNRRAIIITSYMP